MLTQIVETPSSTQFSEAVVEQCILEMTPYQWKRKNFPFVLTQPCMIFFICCFFFGCKKKPQTKQILVWNYLV